MSTDYDVVCSCGERWHLCVRFANNSCIFGNGSNDVDGRNASAEAIVSHVDRGHRLRIVDADFEEGQDDDSEGERV